MPTNFDPADRHTATRGALSAARGLFAAARRRLEPAGGEDGFLLIEVIVSAVLVALIVVGTFNGFDVANRISTEDRQHEQAVVLAAASQEQLRSEPASVLQTLQASPHSYTQTVQGTIYTVKQSAELQPASKAASGACNVSQSGRQSGNAYRITSRVSWKAQETSTRPPVTASSLITPPIGSSLEVDVLSSPGSTTGVSGIPVTVKYKPQGSSGTATQSQTTGSEGCVLFGAVPSLEAEVEVAELLGYVTVDGKPKVKNKTVSLAPNYTVHDNVVYNRAGAIQANFAYSGSATAKHKNNEETGEVTQTVTGDTFLAANNLMEAEPNYELGSTTYGTGSTIPYEVKTGTFQASASSKLNLFPFAEAENGYWGVYAGDCTANNPETVTAGAIKLPAKVIVKPGETTEAAVPTSYTTLNVYGKKESSVNALTHRWEGLEKTTSYPVLVDNLGCQTVSPNPVDENGTPYQHSQVTTTGASMGGHLANPFQPFGKEFSLCLSTGSKTYKVKYGNTALNGGSVNIFLEQRPAATVKAERTEKEAVVKAREPYKEKSGYSNAATEAATEKGKYETEKANYEREKNLYNTAKNNYTTAFNAATAAKSKYTTAKNNYNTAKEKYNTELANYNNYHAKYETEKKNYEVKKTEPYKANYKTDETKYKEYEAKYKTYETQYKEYEAEYKEYEAEYKEEETKYKAYETEYKSYETKYKSFETKYKTYETAYKTDETHATEYGYYLEYVAAKAAVTNKTAEEKEGTSVEVQNGATCT